MKISYPLTTLLISIFCNVFAQTGKLIDISQNTSCENALEINTLEEFGTTTPPSTIDEKDNKSYFQRNLHVVWYKFKVFKTGKLVFNITPLDMLDNYDFVLFKYTGDNFCDEIKNRTLIPVRSNFFKGDINTSGKTGLTISSSYKSYNTAIDVIDGEYYYLVLNNVYESGKGHTIEFKYLDPWNIYFEPNDPKEITKESIEIVDRLSKFLKDNSLKKVHLEGHTNGFVPSTDIDIKLSLERAETIKNKLIEKGIQAERITISGVGTNKLIYPKAANEIEEDLNRRVEITLSN